MYERRKVLELFENDTAWRQKAADGIEKYRKGDATLHIVDAAGKPLTGATVRAVQKSHAFRFGANLFMLDGLESAEKQEKYQAALAELFNMATLPFYWDTLEPVEGAPRYEKESPWCYRRPPIDTCLDFCKKHGIEPREHALAYDAFFPKWLYGASVERVKESLCRRYREVSRRYADRIPTIEVTNEMEWRRGRTAFYDEPDYVEWCFKKAREHFPRNQLVINEVTSLAWADRCRATDKYYAYIEANLLKGAPIDAIGMQFHMFKPAEEEYEKTRAYYNPKNLYRHMDLYASFGKPLQVTEVTIPAYSNRAEDEELQADILENLYRIWFSHPQMEQIIYWNLIDGYAHVWVDDPDEIAKSQGNMTLGENKYYGGLLRFDAGPKPAYHRIRDLIQREWHTEAEMTADGMGKASFRGFYGDYDIEVTVNGKTVKKTVTLSKSGENTVTVGKSE